MSTPSASSRSAEPRAAGRRAVAVLGDRAAGPRGDQRRGGRDVEGRSARRRCPAVSTRSARSISTGAASERIVRARPTSSGTVSPFARSAIRKAPVWTSLDAALHDLGEHRRGVVGGQVVAGADRVDRPGEDVVGHQVARREEVSQQLLALRGQHRLGVELDALGGQLAVADAHHDVAEAGTSARARRAGRGRRPASGSGRRPAGWAGPRRSVRPSCSTSASLPWIGSPRHAAPPNASTSDWWPRQTPSDRRAGLGEGADRLDRDPGLGRRAGPGRDDEPVGARAPAARRRSPCRCGRPRPPPPARPGTGRGCR